HDIRPAAFDTRRLASDDGGGQRRCTRSIGRVLEEHRDQMAWIALRFVSERIARDDRFPLARRTNEEFDIDTQMQLRFGLELPFERSGARVASEHEVAALQQRPRLVEIERLGEL